MKQTDVAAGVGATDTHTDVARKDCHSTMLLPCWYKSYILDSKLHLIMLSQLVFLYKTIEFYTYAFALMQVFHCKKCLVNGYLSH